MLKMVSSRPQLFRREGYNETILNKFQLFHMLKKSPESEIFSSGATQKADKAPRSRAILSFFW